jgi:PKD repeat protein
MNVSTLPLLFAILVCTLNGNGQTIIWSDDFENPANWTLNQSTGLNEVDANSWFISDAEGGMASGSCGAAGNGNKTMHIGCQGTWCAGTGAIYNAGDGGLGFIYATTNKRSVYNANISTVGYSNVSISFDWIGIGQPGQDAASVVYSVDGGVNWTVLQSITGGSNCPNGQGLWQSLSISLPANCQNISTLRIGFQWTNNNDGTGTDPSFAVNNVRLQVPAALSANFSMSQTQICQGECISFSDLSTGSPSGWYWNFGDGGTSSLQNPQHCFDSPGSLTCELVVQNGNELDTFSQIVTVLPAPQTGLQYQNGEINALQNNALYQWILCPSMNIIPGATSSAYVPTINASYAVILTTAGGCSDTSDCIIVNDLGIETEWISTFEIYPNPAADKLWLKSTYSFPVNFEVFQTDGHIVSTDTIKSNEEMELLLSPGTYVMRITHEGESGYKRFIVLP